MRRIVVELWRLDREPTVERLPNDGPEGMVCLADLVNTVGTKSVVIHREDGTVLEYQKDDN